MSIENLIKPMPEMVVLPNGTAAVKGSKIEDGVLHSPDGSLDYMVARQSVLDQKEGVIIDNSHKITRGY